MTDLRHLAIILSVGAKQAEDYRDAALASALTAMTEAAVYLHREGGKVGSVWNVEAEFAALEQRFL